MSGRDTGDIFRPIVVSWSKDESVCEEEAPDPRGLRSHGNKRPKQKTKIKGSKIKGAKTKEVKPKITGQSVMVEEVPRRDTDPQEDNERSQKIKSASLRDLCPEDKQRVANLIKELAKVGEEKEKAMQQLLSERIDFEGHIKELFQQQETILSERESIKEKLEECQMTLQKLQQSNTTHQKHKADIPSSSRKAELYSFHGSPKSQPLSSPDPPKGLPLPDPIILEKANNAPSRPFTQMIDKLIDEDQHSNPQSIEQQLNDSFIETEMRCDKYYGIGPLPPPKLSSTEKSDRSIKGPMTSNGVFRPLPQDDTSSIVQLSPKRIEAVNELVNEEAKARREVIAEQRKMLLEEQQRLRSILSEQETLLKQKQEQLHQQQEVRQQRLECFGQTGAFPTQPQGHFLYPANAVMVPMQYAAQFNAQMALNHQTSASCHKDNIKIKETKSAATSPMRTPYLKKTADCATSPSRQCSTSSVRDAAIQLTPQHVTEHRSSAKASVEDFTTGQLLDLVNEIENYSSGHKQHKKDKSKPRKAAPEVKLPLKSNLKKSSKKFPCKSPADESEESQVLEDIFFL